MSIRSLLPALLLSYCPASSLLAAEDFADSHIHYNWDQQKITSIQQAVDILKDHQVKLTIVSSTPSELALDLRKQGVETIRPDGEPFDPNVAEAVRMQEVASADLDGKVTETVQPGYRLGDLVIRPAKVAVGKKET